jgi:hypothetical protein
LFTLNINNIYFLLLFFQEFDIAPTVCAAIFGVLAFLEAAALIFMGVRARQTAATAATATAPQRAAAVAATARWARVAPLALAIRPRASEEATAPSPEV